MKGTLIQAIPAMRDGVQKSFGSHGSTLYVYKADVQDERGVVYTGEVNAKSEGQYRIAPGTTVEFTYTEEQYGGKLKISIPKDGSAPSAPAPAKPKSFSGGSSWSPEKEASVMVQGFLKSIVESGQKSEHWELAARKMLQIHDKLVAERTTAPAPPVAPPAPPMAAPAPYQHPYAPAPPPQNNMPAPTPPVTGQVSYNPNGQDPQRAYQGAPAPVAAMEEDDLPF
jgi:hypothetical protein